MQIEPTTIQPVTQTASYLQLAPIIEAMRTANDKREKNALPTDTQGTVQSNTKNIPEVTLYNAYGVLNKIKPNSLIAYA